MYRGKGSPAIHWRGVTYTLPKVLRNERKEEYEPQEEPFLNIDGELINDSPLFRFKGGYKFAPMSSTLLDVLITIRNLGGPVKFLPHVDFPVVAYDIIVDHVSGDPRDGIINHDQVTLKIRSQKLVRKIPTIDNMIGTYLPFRVISIIGDN